MPRTFLLIFSILQCIDVKWLLRLQLLKKFCNIEKVFDYKVCTPSCSFVAGFLSNGSVK